MSFKTFFLVAHRNYVSVFDLSNEKYWENFVTFKFDDMIRGLTMLQPYDGVLDCSACVEEEFEEEEADSPLRPVHLPTL